MHFTEMRLHHQSRRAKVLNPPPHFGYLGCCPRCVTIQGMNFSKKMRLRTKSGMGNDMHLHNYIQRHAGTKLILFVVSMVTLVLIAFGTIQYLDNSGRLRSRLDETLIQIADRLQGSVVAPLWDLSTSTLESLVLAEMTEKSLTLVAITEEGKNAPLLVFGRDESGKPRKLGQMPSDRQSDMLPLISDPLILILSPAYEVEVRYFFNG